MFSLTTGTLNFYLTYDLDQSTVSENTKLMAIQAARATQQIEAPI